MRLSQEGIKDYGIWKEKGYGVPEYDRMAVKARTMEQPFWIHFGAGNIFRAFQANVVQKLLNEGKLDRGLIVAEGYDYEIIEKINRPHDDLGIVVTLKADGSIEKNIVGSVVESLCLDSDNEREFERLKEIFRNPALQMATFTITEKGYSLVNGKGERLAAVGEDLRQGPEKPGSYLGKVAALLYERYQNGELPIAMVSMDNCSHNGDKLFAAMDEFAKEWQENGLVEGNFLGYVENRAKVSFPWTMIDKITPRPDKEVERDLVADWGEELKPIVTGKNTYIAPYVNAEESEYLVIEDDFPNGREALEQGGFIMTDRMTVDKVEKMKVCTCLNPLHTTLAVFGCLLGYRRISEEMKDKALNRLVRIIGYQEGLPVVNNPGILSPQEFIDEVIEKRIPNPFMPDTPQRIITDTSQKLAIRFGETIKAYVRSEKLQVENLRMIPLVFAGWLRYLMGIDDAGEQLELSPDPMLTELCPVMAEISLGQTENLEGIQKILANPSIFGVNLYEAGLGELTENYFREMNAGIGAVRRTLEKYCG
ncbi:MAG: mannitol dehydrogenase family protein [Roseburia sp.]|nr:mannitol dehydrogenase family protein [Roseburia sp.]